VRPIGHSLPNPRPAPCAAAPPTNPLIYSFTHPLICSFPHLLLKIHLTYNSQYGIMHIKHIECIVVKRKPRFPGVEPKHRARSFASARIMIPHSLPPSEFVLTRANWWLIHSPRPGKQRCPTCPTNPCSPFATKPYTNSTLPCPRKNKPNSNPIPPTPAPRYACPIDRIRRQGPLPPLRSSGMMSTVKSQDTTWRCSGWLMACLVPAEGTGKSPPGLL